MLACVRGGRGAWAGASDVGGHGWWQGAGSLGVNESGS